MVSIARAMSQPFRILIMDEPTASLTEQEREILFDRIRWLKDQGIGIIYTTHRLDELPAVADRVTVLRDGQRILTTPMTETNERELVNVMVGRDIHTYFPPKLEGTGTELLRVERLTKAPLFQDVTFSLFEGEILGISGLVGSGKTDLAKSLFGEVRKQSGHVYWRGKEVDPLNPHSAVKQGFGYVDDNRLENGLVLEMSTVKNMTLTIADKLTSMEFINPNKEREAALDKMIELDIKLSDPDREVKYLSGGNQQKVLIAKWLVQDSDLYILNEPTKGIDVGARVDLYLAIHELARQGKGMIVISSDLSELQGLCSRVLVMEDGRLTEEAG
jgi:ABC-type sugar transport system ATPase subunit